MYSFVFLTNDQNQGQRLRDLVTSLKGTVKEEKSLGNKTFAYPINKIESADYFEWSFEMPAASMNEFKKKLTFEDNLIRYLLLNKED